MTTLVYRDGIMAVDWQVSLGQSILTGRKVYFVKDAVIGITGDLYAALAFIEWYKGTAKKREEIASSFSSEEDFECLVITDEGITTWNYMLTPMHVHECEYFALGSGLDAALGAFWMGADAIQAVQAACAVNTQTGCKVLAVDVKKSLKRKKLVETAVAVG